jgi:hypothetical protein
MFTQTSIACLIALRIQQAERQRTTPQAKPPKHQRDAAARSQGTAGAKRREPVDVFRAPVDV